MNEGQYLSAFVGLATASGAVGSLTNPAYGWLMFGVGIIVLVVISIFLRSPYE